MVIETITLSLLLGKLMGGKIRNIGNLYINGWYLFVVAFSVEIISLLIVSKTGGNLSDIIENNFFYIHIFIYLLLIIGLIMNFHENGLRITLFGSILNFLPLSLNSGRMPVAINALKVSKLYTQLSLLEEGRIMTHTLANKATKLTFLGDIIPIPKPYPFPKIISIGDVLISLGLLILILSYMRKKYESQGKTIEFYRP
ncbi:hypothetical protein CIW83_15295 [Tissierella sp. P1]|jgi:uncharacterized membrane protein|uniref:DUF5317 domain-containing protein n=1 Tax=Tissierella TaxID=41273 RepID=UPI000B9FD0C8|nr:DUF5317 domain-containing protein [Tissierella sp. P1]MDU5082087.1 DUF5317 domain-containing protein [Bacillota bacterium]OZV11337.1 hypothetical protein CIW83_15295 [Tissierella sp. P1]